MTNTPEYLQNLETKRLNKSIKTTLRVASIFAVLLPVCYFVWFGVFNKMVLTRSEPALWGSFGDFIGGLLNPVVAFLALFWLTRSIAIQREELRDTKAALEKANIAQQEQAATLEKQRFEDTFFALVDQHNKVLDQLNAKTSAPNSSSDIDLMYWPALSSNKQTLAEASARFKQDDDLSGHYFRILYQILKLVATRTPGTTLGSVFSASAITASTPSAEEKLYSNIIRSFLSTRVTQLLAVNCYCADDSSTFWNYKCLVERYALLEHMPFTIRSEVHPVLRDSTSHFTRNAFGDSEFLAQMENGTRDPRG